MLNLKETEFKTLEEIKKIAPSIFTTNGAANTSARYAHVSTSRVIEDLAKLGWGVVDVKEVKARKNVGYQKHLVVLRNSDITIESKGDTVFPQILISNSHDGKNAFTFRAGLFRLVCENGLGVSDEDFEKLSIRHYGYTFEELQKTINTIVEKLPHTVESMNRLKQRQLTESEFLSVLEMSPSSDKTTLAGKSTLEAAEKAGLLRSAELLTDDVKRRGTLSKLQAQFVHQIKF